MAHDGPVAIRYLRGVGIGVQLADDPQPLPIGQGELLRDGKDAVIIAIGSRVLPSLQAAIELETEAGLSVAVYNARFVKPLPEEDILELAGRFGKILTVEENALQGGFGSAVLEFLSDSGALTGQTVKRLGVPDHFVEHGPQKALRELLGIHKEGVKAAVRELAAKA